MLAPGVDSFPVPIVLSFLKCHVPEIAVCSFVRLASFTQRLSFQVPPVFSGLVHTKQTAALAPVVPAPRVPT